MRVAAIIVLILSLALGMALCKHQSQRELDRLSKVEPFEKMNPSNRFYFYFVGFVKDEPRFVTLNELDENYQHREIETFYIEQERLDRVRKDLEAGETRGIDRISELKIERDDPKQRSQRIHLAVHSDEYSYFLVYDVFADRVKPVGYGDRTIRDRSMSCRKAMQLFFVIFGAGIAISLVLFVTATRKQRAISQG